MEENEILEFDLNNSNNGTRTGTLTTASVLSWIMGGLMVLGSLFMLLLKGFLIKALEEGATTMTEDQKESIRLLLQNYYEIFVFSLIAYSISIFAVILMYRLKKVGFYIYAPLHVLIFIYPYVTYQTFQLNGGVFFSAGILVLFLLLYGSNLKHMK